MSRIDPTPLSERYGLALRAFAALLVDVSRTGGGVSGRNNKIALKVEVINVTKICHF